MDKLHNDNLKILDEFVRISKINNLNFFLVGGTALGAIRHKGFIPWDDDVDVGMKRADFNRFCQVVDQHLDSKYFFVSHTEYEFPFMKIYLKNTLIESDDVFSNNRPEFIDIFPYDPIKKGEDLKYKTTMFTMVRRLIQLKKVSISQGIEMYNAKTKIRYHYFGFLIIFLFKCILFFLPVKSLLHIRNKIMYKNPNSDDMWITWGSPYSFDKGALLNPDDIIFTTFENRELPIMAEYKSYLASLYGDFMSIPPENERKGHHVKKNR